VPQLFLADAIENGAGFMTHIRAPATFVQLIDETMRLVNDNWDDQREHDCDSSCPGCLRDWSNTPYHPLLDWRLAADALEAIVHDGIERDRWDTVRTRAVHKVCEDFEWTVLEDGRRPVLDTGKGVLVCVVHPLDRIDDGLDAGIDTDHGRAMPFDCFNFDRRPGEIFRRL
jgi:hypothetical protein